MSPVYEQCRIPGCPAGSVPEDMLITHMKNHTPEERNAWPGGPDALYALLGQVRQRAAQPQEPRSEPRRSSTPRPPRNSSKYAKKGVGDVADDLTEGLLSRSNRGGGSGRAPDFDSGGSSGGDGCAFGIFGLFVVLIAAILGLALN